MKNSGRFWDEGKLMGLVPKEVARRIFVVSIPSSLPQDTC